MYVLLRVSDSSGSLLAADLSVSVHIVDLCDLSALLLAADMCVLLLVAAINQLSGADSNSPHGGNRC